MKITLKTLLTGVLGALALLGGQAEARDFKLAMQTNPGTAQYDGVEKFAALVKEKSEEEERGEGGPRPIVNTGTRTPEDLLESLKPEDFGKYKMSGGPWPSCRPSSGPV